MFSTFIPYFSNICIQVCPEMVDYSSVNKINENKKSTEFGNCDSF